MMEAEVRVRQLPEEGGRSRGMQTVSRCWKRPGNRFSITASRKKYNFSNTLILAQ